jgi:hypothetical protein
MLLIPDDPTIKNKPQETLLAATDWLNRYRAYHLTPEGYGVRFELANAYLAQAQRSPPRTSRRPTSGPSTKRT